MAEGWERAGLFSSPLSQRIFVSKSQPEIILSLRAEPRRAAPLPDSEADFQALAESKKQLIQKIPSISSWEPELYSWTPERKTLFLKGILIRRGQKFFFSEWHFYREAQIIQALAESRGDFSDREDLARLLDYIREGAGGGGLW